MLCSQEFWSILTILSDLRFGLEQSKTKYPAPNKSVLIMTIHTTIFQLHYVYAKNKSAQSVTAYIGLIPTISQRVQNSLVLSQSVD